MDHPNIPSEVFKQIQEAIRLPEGTFAFKYHSKDLLDNSKPGGIILEIPSGQLLFRLERDNSLFLHFYYSSPGTGTRVASIDLNPLPVAETVLIEFSWSPQEIYLRIEPSIPNGKPVIAAGVPSAIQFRVGADGSIMRIGDQNVKVLGTHIYKGGRPVLEPTALETWHETIEVLNILGTGKSTEGYIFDVTIANLTLVVLTTGFEAYTKKRFLELEDEGSKPNLNNLIDSFYPRREKEAGIRKILEDEANEAAISILKWVVSKRVINFQNFTDAKKAYNKTYGIKFGELDVTSQKLEILRAYFGYRHKIIHVSTLPGILNQENIPPEEPVFMSKEKAQEAMGCFQEFIENLHQATLALRS